MCNSLCDFLLADRFFNIIVRTVCLTAFQVGHMLVQPFLILAAEISAIRNHILRHLLGGRPLFSLSGPQGDARQSLKVHVYRGGGT